MSLVEKVLLSATDITKTVRRTFEAIDLVTVAIEENMRATVVAHHAKLIFDTAVVFNDHCDFFRRKFGRAETALIQLNNSKLVVAFAAIDDRSWNNDCVYLR